MLERLKAVKDLFINDTFEVALKESGSERWRRSRLYRITLLRLLSIPDRFKQTVVNLFAKNHSFLRQRHGSRLEVVFLHLFLFIRQIFLQRLYLTRMKYFLVFRCRLYACL